MKLPILILIISTAILAAEDIRVSKNIFGGKDIYKNGIYQGRTTKNIFGGYNYENSKGRRVGQSTKNIFGGKNYKVKGNSFQSMSNIFGGENFIQKGKKVGYSQKNIRRGKDYHFKKKRYSGSNPFK